METRDPPNGARPNLQVITDKNHAVYASFDELLHQLREEHVRLVRNLEADNRALRVTNGLHNGMASAKSDGSCRGDSSFSRLDVTGASPQRIAAVHGTERTDNSAGKFTASDSVSPRLDNKRGYTIPDGRRSYAMLRQVTSRISHETLIAINDADEVDLLPEWQRDSAIVRQLPAIFITASKNPASRELNLMRPVKMRMRTHSSFQISNDAAVCGCQSCLADLVLSPTSRTRMVWDFLGILFLMYDFVWIPLQAFDPRRFTFTRTCDWMATIYWTLDILVHFFTAYIRADGKIERRLRKICHHYVKKGSFLLDAFIVVVDWCVVALDLTGATSSNDAENAGALRAGKFVRIMRIMRACRLLRLRKLRHMLFLLEDHINSEVIFIFFNTVKNLATIMAMNHIIACIWWSIGSAGRGDDHWIDAYDLHAESMAAQYLVSLHWSLTQFTPATMHVNPQNAWERFFTVAVIVIAMISFSTFVSSITASMTRIRALQGSELSQYFMLRKFLRENHVSRDLSARVHRYINLAEQINRRRIEIGKVELLNILSGPLRVELQKELFAPHLEKHPFFGSYVQVSSAAMSQLCFTATERRYVGRGDLLFSCASASRNMGFLAKGCLLYQRPPGLRWSTRPLSSTQATPAHLQAYVQRNRRRFIMLKEQSWYCEACLWVPWVHHGTMAALIESEIITLNSESFRQVTLEHSNVFQECKHYALTYLDHLQDWKNTHGRLWDIPQEVVFPSPENRGEVASISSMSPSPDTDEVKYAHLLQAFFEVEEESDEDDDEDTRHTNLGVDSTFAESIKQAMQPQVSQATQASGVHSAVSNPALLETVAVIPLAASGPTSPSSTPALALKPDGIPQPMQLISF